MIILFRAQKSQQLFVLAPKVCNITVSVRKPDLSSISNSVDFDNLLAYTFLQKIILKAVKSIFDYNPGVRILDKSSFRNSGFRSSTVHTSEFIILCRMHFRAS